MVLLKFRSGCRAVPEQFSRSVREQIAGCQSTASLSRPLPLPLPLPHLLPAEPTKRTEREGGRVLVDLIVDLIVD